MPQKFAEYQQHAADCRRLARSALNEEERKQLLIMASTWDGLVMYRAKLTANRSEIKD
jgi:hypothetical protein